MIGDLPRETAEAIGRDIAIAAWTWLGCILLLAVLAAVLAAMALRAKGRRRRHLGTGAGVSGVLSVALLLWLPALVGR